MIFVQKHISQKQGQQAQMINTQMKQNFESNIFVQFVPKEVTDEQFTEEMSKACGKEGKIVSIKLRNQE